MKKLYIFLLLVFSISVAAFAQGGHDKISYQSVVRDGNNHLVYNTQVTVAVSIANHGNPAVVYSETHTVTSNDNGLISFLIGDGSSPSGDWDAVQWNRADITLVTSVGGVELSTHTFPLSAVPYALHAKDADTASYADSVDLDVVQHYLDDNGYLPEVPQVLSISNDTIYLTRGGWVKLPVVDYHKIANKPLKTDLCDSVKDCVTAWIYDTLDAYYDTTHMKTAIHDTADALRSIMSDAANDGKITIQKNGGEVGHFTVNQSEDQSINIEVPTTVAEMTDADNYVTNAKLKDTLNKYTTTNQLDTVVQKYNYAKKDTLKNYLTISGLCDSVMKCDGIKTMRDSIKTNAAAIVTKANAVDVYTKTETDDLLGAKVDTGTVYTKAETDDLLGAKVDTGTVYTKTETDDLLGAKVDTGTVYTKTETDDLLGAKVDTGTVYTKTETDDLLGAKVDTGTVYTKAETDDLLGAKVDTGTVYTKTETYNKAEVNGLLSAKINSADLCDSIVKCEVIKDMRDSLDNAFDTLKYYFTKTQVDSAANKVRSEIGNGKLTIRYSNNDLNVFGANQDTNTTVNIPAPVYGTLTLTKNDETIETFTANETKTINIPVPTTVAELTDASNYLTAETDPSVNNKTITIQKNGITAGNFSLNQDHDQTINLENVANTDASNTFTQKNTFSDTVFTAPDYRGLTLTGENATTESNCNVVVNACDLLAVLESLNDKIHDLEQALEETQQELEEVKNTTMPALQLTSDKPSEIKAGQGETVNITHTANLLRTDGEFTYVWYVNGTLQDGEANNTLVYSTNNAGTYKVLCVATSVSNPNIVLKDSLTTTICIRPSMNYAFVGDDQSADYGKIQITSSTATSATWKDENDAVIGTWNEDFTDVLPSGEYTVVLVSADCDSNLTIKIPALRLSSDPNIQSDTCIGEAMEIVYETTKQLTDAAFTYKWFVNGEELTGRTNDSLHYTINESGTYKVLCKATASADLILKDSLTYTISVKPIMNYTVIGGDSANFGKIRIDNCTATSAKWYDEDENEIGEWKSGYTSILPVGEYTVKLSSSTDGCDATLTIEVNASPLCRVNNSVKGNETSIAIGGQEYVTIVKDHQNHSYNIVEIAGYCWTRENLRCTEYYDSVNHQYVEINDGSSVGVSATTANTPYLYMPAGGASYLDKGYGYLYNWTAATGNAIDYITQNNYYAYTRGVCPEGWHLPSYYDVYYMIHASVTGARSNSGKLAGAGPDDDTWTPVCETSSAPCNHNYEERNCTGFSAIRSGYFANDYFDYGAYFWTSYRYAAPNDWAGIYLGVHNSLTDVLFTGNGGEKEKGLSVRCVRNTTPDPPTLSLSSSEGSHVMNCGQGSVTVNYTATIENDDQAGYTSYTWSVSPAIVSATTTTTNTYSLTVTESGTYTVSCEATNGTATINADFTTNVGCAPSVEVCIDSNLTATVWSTTDEPTSIDWGDGTAVEEGVLLGKEHHYNTHGDYTIQVSNQYAETPTSIQRVVPEKPHTTCTVSQIFGNEVADGSSTTVIKAVKDHENNSYEVIQIGSQCWLRQNMRCTTSPSSPNTYIVRKDFVANFPDSVEVTYTGKMARWYNNDSVFAVSHGYGLLYNWNATVDTFNTDPQFGETSVSGDISKAVGVDEQFSTNRRGICPAGWHVPSNQEWATLETTVNNNITIPAAYGWHGSYAGKLATSCFWTNISRAGTAGHNTTELTNAPGDYSNQNRNISGFSALPAGWCGPGNSDYTFGAFEQAGPDNLTGDAVFTTATFWTSDQSGLSSHAWCRYLCYNSYGVYNKNSYKNACFSVRCVRD